MRFLVILLRSYDLTLMRHHVPAHGTAHGFNEAIRRLPLSCRRRFLVARQNAVYVRVTGKAVEKSLSPPQIPDEFLVGRRASASTEAVMPMVPERRYVERSVLSVGVYSDQNRKVGWPHGCQLFRPFPW